MLYPSSDQLYSFSVNHVISIFIYNGKIIRNFLAIFPQLLVVKKNIFTYRLSKGLRSKHATVFKVMNSSIIIFHNEKYCYPNKKYYFLYLPYYYCHMFLKLALSYSTHRGKIIFWQKKLSLFTRATKLCNILQKNNYY